MTGQGDSGRPVMAASPTRREEEAPSFFLCVRDAGRVHQGILVRAATVSACRAQSDTGAVLAFSAVLDRGRSRGGTWSAISSGYQDRLIFCLRAAIRGCWQRPFMPRQLGAKSQGVRSESPLKHGLVRATCDYPAISRSLGGVGDEFLSLCGRLVAALMPDEQA